jgi:hypothetical protein
MSSSTGLEIDSSLIEGKNLFKGCAIRGSSLLNTVGDIRSYVQRGSSILINNVSYDIATAGEWNANCVQLSGDYLGETNFGVTIVIPAGSFSSPKKKTTTKRANLGDAVGNLEAMTDKFNAKLNAQEGTVETSFRGGKRGGPSGRNGNPAPVRKIRAHIEAAAAMNVPSETSQIDSATDRTVNNVSEPPIQSNQLPKQPTRPSAPITDTAASGRSKRPVSQFTAKPAAASKATGKGKPSTTAPAAPDAGEKEKGEEEEEYDDDYGLDEAPAVEAPTASRKRVSTKPRVPKASSAGTAPAAVPLLPSEAKNPGGAPVPVPLLPMSFAAGGGSVGGGDIGGENGDGSNSSRVGRYSHLSHAEQLKLAEEQRKAALLRIKKKKHEEQLELERAAAAKEEEAKAAREASEAKAAELQRRTALRVEQFMGRKQREEEEKRELERYELQQREQRNQDALNSAVRHQKLKEMRMQAKRR